MMRFYFNAYPLLASLVFAGFIVAAHLAAPASYHWTRNTISDLGAQQYANGWIMQVGFLAFGLLLSGGILRDIWVRNTSLLPEVPLLVYGLAVGLTGIFCTKPFWPTPSFSASESQLHSMLAQVAGMAFSAAILVKLFRTDDTATRLIHGTALLLVMGFSASFKFFSDIPGVFQRLLYLVSLTWLSGYYHT